MWEHSSISVILLDVYSILLPWFLFLKYLEITLKRQGWRRVGQVGGCCALIKVPTQNMENSVDSKSIKNSETKLFYDSKSTDSGIPLDNSYKMGYPEVGLCIIRSFIKMLEWHLGLVQM